MKQELTGRWRTARILVTLYVTLALGQVLAQAVAVPGAVDSGLIFDLLGTANAVEVTVSEEIDHVFLVAVHQGEIVMDAGREVTEDVHTVTFSAGALMAVRD